ncbi:MAG: VOC family protein [Bacteroidota bacterium]|nr:VOC family protein [Bacteroidota bacterium]
MAQLIAHAEIPVKDIDKAKAFYEQLFGWEFRPFGNGYLLFNNHKGITIGLKKVDEIQSGNTTIFHINIKEIEKYLDKAKELGGKEVRAKTIIPAMGYYALVGDLDGNTIGLFQTN